jgi:hypothetical protein
MHTKMMAVGAVALMSGLGASMAAHASLQQFALVGGTPLTYTYVSGNPSASTISTPAGGVNETLTFPAGSSAASLFPSGIMVNIKITGLYDGPLVYQPSLIQPLHSNPANATWLEWSRDFQDVDVTVTYTGSGDIMNGAMVLLSPGETVFTLTDVNAAMSGESQNPTVSGNYPAPAGVSLTFDDQAPPSSGDYSDGTGNFYDFMPGGDDVVEDSFTFNDSSKRAVLQCTGTCPLSYEMTGEFHLKSQGFSPNGNFSADP